ncbi:MAG: glucuronate isomerase [Erysipelotrichaceae bacterium]|nr:glucuronate isomerase [Erysipelotrichaceae bacterium]
MKEFMGKDFLLTNDVAKHLYHDYAAKMPIIDYHCHISQKEIYENRQFKTITEVWLGGDHYKWRQMRTNGIDEKYITGDASDLEKFKAWAKTLSHLIGNPLYHWSHLELQRYFHIYEPLTEDNAEEIFNRCNEILKTLTVRKILEDSRVNIICTTDDPCDDLHYHKLLKEDQTLKTLVVPCFRPDKANNIEKKDYLEYIAKLEEVSERKITNFKELCDVLDERIDFFASMGCRASDHALEYVMYEPAEEEEIERIFAKRLNGEMVDRKEELRFKTALMRHLAKVYYEKNWVMQLHYGARRDNNTRMYEKLGPDTGYDAINNQAPSSEMAAFLDSLEKENSLPKTVIYSLNPNDNAVIMATIGCFQGESKGKLQHGSAWWFNDHKKGMLEQMETLANDGMLANFIGMLTDSRSFLSYTRHEYFRRILCDFIGTLVENGEYPNDDEILKEIVENISYYNAVEYLGFNDQKQTDQEEE